MRGTAPGIALTLLVALRLGACREFDSSTSDAAGGADGSGDMSGGAPAGGKAPLTSAGQLNAGGSRSQDPAGGSGDSAGYGGEPSDGGTGETSAGHGGGESVPASGAGAGGDTGTASTPLAPDDFTGLAWWLEASTCETASIGGAGSDEVEACPDSSGNANQAVATAEDTPPVLVDDALNGRAVLRFEGSPSILSVADAPSLRFAQSQFTLLLVARWRNVERVTDVYGGCGVILTKVGSQHPFTGLALYANYPQYSAHIPAMTRFAGQLEQGSAFALSATTDVNDDQFRIYGMRRLSPVEMELRINGRREGTSQLKSELDASARGFPLVLGGNVIQPLRGDIAEVVAIRGQIGDEDVSRLERHLFEKYALTP